MNRKPPSSSAFQRFYRSTVFYNVKNPIIQQSNQILAVYFHRVAALSYFFYTVWALISFLDARSDDQDWFPLYVMPIALGASLGATFFPRTGRLELFASGSLIVLICIFLWLATASSIHHGSDTWAANLALNLTHLIVPVARTIFILKQLLRDAMKRSDS